MPEFTIKFSRQHNFKSLPQKGGSKEKQGDSKQPVNPDDESQVE
jgi:hypothetical protein